MNPLTWLENHPNAALVAVIGGSIAFAALIGWLFHWYVLDARYWFPRTPGVRYHRTDPLEDGRRYWVAADDGGWIPGRWRWKISARRGVAMYLDGLEDDQAATTQVADEWEPEPYTEADADRLIADLTTDLPGPDSLPAPWAGEHHERVASADIFAQLADDPDIAEWNLACHVERLREHEIGARSDVARIREIRGELAALRELYAA